MSIAKTCTNKSYTFDAFYKGKEISIELNYCKYDKGLKWCYTVKLVNASLVLKVLFNGNAPSKQTALEIIESRLVDTYGTKTTN